MNRHIRRWYFQGNGGDKDLHVGYDIQFYRRAANFVFIFSHRVPPQSARFPNPAQSRSAGRQKTGAKRKSVLGPKKKKNEKKLRPYISEHLPRRVILTNIKEKIGRAHIRNPSTWPIRMPSSGLKKKKLNRHSIHVYHLSVIF